MADSRHLENRKTAIFPQRFDRSAQNLARCCILIPLPEGYGQLKVSAFKNSRWRTAAILKNRKRPHLRNGSTDLQKIWYDDAF